MGDVVSIHAAQVARDVAIDQVERAAGAAWLTRAVAAISFVARIRPEFTTDEVWQVLSGAGEAGRPREPRAMGAAMRVAHLTGICVPTTETMMSIRVACHRRPLRIWRRA